MDTSNAQTAGYSDVNEASTCCDKHIVAASATAHMHVFIAWVEPESGTQQYGHGQMQGIVAVHICVTCTAMHHEAGDMCVTQALVASFNALVQFNTNQGVCAAVVIEIMQASGMTAIRPSTASPRCL